MPKRIPTLLLVLGMMLMLPTTSLPAAADEETARLERAALCQAMPYRCPGSSPDQDVDPHTRQVNERCERLEPHRWLIRSKQMHHTPLDPADAEALRVWNTSCRAWEERQRTVQQRKAAARTRNSSTIDCVTTWDDGRYASRLSTTCTSY